MSAFISRGFEGRRRTPVELAAPGAANSLMGRFAAAGAFALAAQLVRADPRSQDAQELRSTQGLATT